MEKLGLSNEKNISLVKYKDKKGELRPQEQLALQLFNGGIDAITAHKQLLALETKELNERIIELMLLNIWIKERAG